MNNENGLKKFEKLMADFFPKNKNRGQVILIPCKN
jgi:hypothetical protein